MTKNIVRIIVSLTLVIGMLAAFTVPALPWAAPPVGAVGILLGTTTGPVGTPVYIYADVTKDPFPSSTPITVTWYHTATSTETLSIYPPTATSTSTTGDLPAMYIVVPATKAGAHNVKVAAGPVSATATFTVTPKITVTPTSGAAGSAITVTGSGYAASSTITVLNFTDMAATVTNLMPTTAPATDSRGSITVAVTIPNSAAAGAGIVRITDGAANTATAAFTVVAPAITLTPDTGIVGSTLYIAGIGFHPASTVIFRYGLNAIASTPSPVTADAVGAFTTAIVVPVSHGVNTITAFDNATLPWMATANFTVVPAITLTPSGGNVGCTVTVNGTGFTAAAVVTLTFNLSSVIWIVPVATDAYGNFSGNFIVPSSNIGLYVVTATAGTTTATSAFTVINHVVITSLQQYEEPVTKIIYINVNIDLVKNPATGETVLFNGGLGAYDAVTTFNSNGIQLVDVVGVAPFDSPVKNLLQGVFNAYQTSTTIHPPLIIARLAPILVGSCASSYKGPALNYSLSVNFDTITSVGGEEVPAESAQTMTFCRGNARVTPTDDKVNITDALYIAQYLAGLRPLSNINALNAASVKHDGTTGDKITITDALYVAQYLAGMKDINFNLVS